jgi:polyphosphate:AMP phosphotransferase
MLFEAAEVGETLDKQAYEKRLPDLREELLDAEFRLRNENFSVVVVIAGAEGAGKGETVNCLLEWFDARGVETHAMSQASAEESERPPFYRFWLRLPPHGKIGIFFGSWYTTPIVQRIAGTIDDADFERRMRQIVDFERMLASENVLLIKVWLHITKRQQKQKLKELEKDPATAWRVNEQDWEYYKTYDEFITVASSAVRLTSTGHAPWHIVEAADRRHRNVNVGEHILNCLVKRLDAPLPDKPQPEPLPTPRPKNLINILELDQPLSRDDYNQELSKWQGELAQLARRMSASDLSAVLVFEGSDGAGKGGCIRRVVHALDARFYRVYPVAAPTDEEQARPYLWRFWRTLPRKGRICVYDRSWYGRVLVERIEGFCSPTDWRRAYSEINAFEQELNAHRILVIKFWLTISSEEQLRRFKLREETGYKRYKLTDEDWRNREKAPAYEAAACDMIAQTNTVAAPWTLVEADNKLFARIKVLSTVCERLQSAIGSAAAPDPGGKRKKEKKNSGKKSK